MVENVGPGSQACPSCGLTYVSWGHHVRYHGCKPPVAGVCAPCDESPSADEQPSMWDAEPRWREMASELGEKLAVMHLHSKVHISECRLAVELAEQAVSHVINACRAVVSSDESAAAAIDGVRVQASATLKQLRDIDAVCAKQATGALVPVPRPLLSPPEASKKQFAFFSVEHLLRDEVQNDAETRWHVKSSTEEWKTGKFRQPPTVITTVLDSDRALHPGRLGQTRPGADESTYRPGTTPRRCGACREHCCRNAPVARLYPTWQIRALSHARASDATRAACERTRPNFCGISRARDRSGSSLSGYGARCTNTTWSLGASSTCRPSCATARRSCSCSACGRADSPSRTAESAG